MDRRFGFMVRSEGGRISCYFNGLADGDKL